MHRIVEGNSFELVIIGQEKTGGTVENIDLSPVDELAVYLVKAGRGRKLMAYTINEAGEIVMSVDAAEVSKGIYGVEVIGKIEDTAIHAQQPSAFQIVDGYHRFGDAGAVMSYEVNIVMIYNTAANKRYVDAAVAAEAEARQAADEALGERIDNAGKVDDVLIDGVSILDPDTKEANIPTSMFGKVDDVKVNGVSVRDEETKEANINITASVVEDDTPGTPAANATMQDGNINIEFEHVKGERGNGIASVTEVISNQDGGINTHTIHYTDQNVPDSVIHTRNGQTGRPGADRQPVESGDVIIAHGLGYDEEKVMSQKSVTEALDIKIKEYTSEDIIAQNEGWTISRYIMSNTWYNTSSTQIGRRLNVESHRGKTIKITANSINDAKFAFVTAVGNNGDPVSYANDSSLSTLTKATSTSVVVPNDAVFLYLSYTKNTQDTNNVPDMVEVFNRATDALTIALQGIETLQGGMAVAQEDITSIQGNIGDLQDGLGDANKVISQLADESNVELIEHLGSTIVSQKEGWVLCRYIMNDKWYQTLAYHKAFRLDVTNLAGKTIKICANPDADARFALVASYGNAGDGVIYADEGRCSYTTVPKGSSTIVVIPNDAEYLIVDSFTSDEINNMVESVVFYGSIKEVVENIAKNNDSKLSYHVKANGGSDANDGLTEATAFATIAKAVEMSGVNLAIILHGDTSEPISISGKKSVSIIAPAGEHSRILCGTPITEAESAEGYEGVLKTEVSLPVGYTSGGNDYGIWLWQHGIEDTATYIPFEEVHPLQRGRTYRCPSTKLALAESIQAVSDNVHPSYYHDGTYLYFKIAEGTTLAENPVYIRSDEEGLDIYAETVRLHGIECWYGKHFAVSATQAEITECSAMFGTSGFRWGAQSARLTRCEACGCYDPSGNGDGFGSAKGSATLIDCWAHDCFDDGYSEHAGSESTIIGGLYEYCGKACIVPASGALLTVYGAVCRRSNGNGVTVQMGNGSGIVASSPNGGTNVYANGVVCADNSINFRTGAHRNIMTLVNCKSVRATEYGFYANWASWMYLHDCTDVGSTNTKGIGQEGVAKGHIVVNNGELVD